MNAHMLTAASSVIGGGGVRPLPVQQPSILPFDDDADGCLIHTSLPPGMVIPKTYDINFVRQDSWGVTLKETPPFVPGANTTPPEMVMSYQLPWYPREWQDKILTAHAERNLSHFHLDRYQWVQAGLSDAQAVDLMAYIQSWGFYTSFWAMGTTIPGHTWADVGPWAIPLVQMLQARGLSSKSMYVVGEELNSYVVYGEDGLDNIVRQLCAMAPEMPVVLHFTSNYPGCYGADVSGEVAWYQKLSAMGLWGTFWQADPYNSAALMGAHLWDTRKYMAQADTRLHCSAFELRGMPQLFGQCDETGGARTGWEMICCPPGSDVPNAPPVAGGQAARYPDGTPL